MEISDENWATSVTSTPVSDLSSSDSDACNTASARIHFGPLRSPEKEFVSIAHPRKTLQSNALVPPLPQSPRSPTPVPDSPIIIDEADEKGDGNDVDSMGYHSHDHSRSGTPDNDIFLHDEPSSVLATKIIRAYDNPSPPPQALDLPDTASPQMAEFDAPEPQDITGVIAPTIDRANEGHTPPEEVGPSFCTNEPALPALPLHSVPPFSSVDSKSSASQRDLISFDPLCAPLPEVMIPAPDVSLAPRMLPPTLQPTSGNDHTSVDDLLSQSPKTSPSSKATSVSNSPSVPQSWLPLSGSPVHVADGNHDNADVADSADEQAIASALMYTEVEHFSRPLSPLPVVLPPSPREEGEDKELVRTPIRRSTRPRRSGTPYSFRTYSPLFTAGGVPLFSAQDQPLTPPRRLGLASQSNAATQKKRRKMKERAAPSGDELVSDSHSRESESRSASTEPTWKAAESVDVNPQKVDAEESNGQVSGKEGKRREDGNVGKTEKEAGKYALSRELGSLSPDSASLLTQLLPSTKNSPVLQEADMWKESTTYKPPAVSFLALPQRQEAPFVIQRASAQEKSAPFTSPVHSPSKVRSVALDDPDWTPARRIPIEQAILQGQISPQKAAHFNAYGVTSSTGVMRNPIFSRTMDTPARRVPISESTPMNAQGRRQASPVRAMSRERSRPGASKPFGATGGGKGRSGSVEQERRPQPLVTESEGLHVRSQSGTPRSGLGSKLPFLIVPANDPPKSIPKDGEDALVSSDVDGLAKDRDTTSTSITSPTKSSLRQPSVVSRIPRIGIKPYAKPAVATPMGIWMGRKKPAVTKTGDVRATTMATQATKPFRAVGSGSGSAYEDVASNPPPASVGLNAASRSTDTPVTANLKRKRGTETLSPIRRARPTVMSWQPGAGSRNFKQTPKVVAPAKVQEPRALRHVVDRDSGASLDNRSDQISLSGLKAEVETTDAPATKQQQAGGEDSVSAMPTSGDNTPSSSSPVHDVPSPTQLPPGDKDPNSRTFLPSKSGSESLGKVRRTTRQRKPVQPSPVADVFGTVEVRPLQPRRKAPAHSSTRGETGAFSGMSAVTLRALTSSNTARNQKYLTATLETEIIRKEGVRPESPMVKVRTLLQRQKEEKGKQRMERAARRARRSEDGSGMSDTDGLSDPVDSSLADVDDSWADDEQHDEGLYHRQHRRGPGDEEDYESPDKLERPMKRLKFEEDGGESARVGKRRVKWDRGLSTTIYLDDVQPGTRARPKENVNAKGCLAKTAKARRLDILGNLPNADAPLADLVHENVVVKKFVYDNDTEPPTEEVYIVRSTRSRSKAKA